MTDKEIIINGVNIAGCKYLNKVVNEEPYCNIDEEHLYTCSSDENCYYKQLKRLEQENAELKAENDRLKECNKELTSDNLNTIQEMDNERRRVEQLKEEITELEEKFLTLNGKSYSYYKTLQEIKKIAEDMYEDYSKRWDDNISEGLEQIIDLITKAEGK